jgi:hypothetical protein
LTTILTADRSLDPTLMKTSFPTDTPENHASELAVAVSLVARLKLVLTSRLATFLSLVVLVITITPGGVR